MESVSFLNSDEPSINDILDARLRGAVVVADDQHINLEILKQHTLNLGV